MLSIDVRKRLREFELDIRLDVPDGVTLLMGPSGSGKTTLLRLIAGVLQPDAGRVAAGEHVFSDPRTFVPAFRRNVGVVFQEYALFPHLNARDNVEFGLRARGVGRAERERRAGDLLERFEIGALGGARVDELSGGQRQRVALARALAIEPAVLLLDEPLSALDAATRGRMRRELYALLRDVGVPTLLVTHDRGDVEAFPERVFSIERGRAVAALPV
jgi:ABC-type sulfate/molybdate transport systems ATPase subunit